MRACFRGCVSPSDPFSGLYATSEETQEETQTETQSDAGAQGNDDAAQRRMLRLELPLADLQTT